MSSAEENERLWQLACSEARRVNGLIEGGYLVAEPAAASALGPKLLVISRFEIGEIRIIERSGGGGTIWFTKGDIDDEAEIREMFHDIKVYREVDAEEPVAGAFEVHPGRLTIALTMAIAALEGYDEESAEGQLGRQLAELKSAVRRRIPLRYLKKNEDQP